MDNEEFKKETHASSETSENRNMQRELTRTSISNLLTFAVHN